MPELRKDPIVGRWVIISTDRAKRPTDFVRENMKIKGGLSVVCYGNETKTPPRSRLIVPIQMAALRRRGIHPAGPCEWCLTSFRR